MTNPISVCMIASNEAANIVRALGSVHGWVHEIVLVHNDCRDDTEVIARARFGALTFEEKWHGHRDQKNIALSKASQPWVLCLDADEEVSPELKREIVSTVQQNDPVIHGARFPRSVFLLGRWIRHGDWYPDYSLRLARREHARWAGSREHDRLDVDGKIVTLKADLYHYTVASLNHHLHKITYFGDIFLQRQLDAGKKFRGWNVILRSAWRFVRAYFFRMGFLDGYPGFYIAFFTAFATFFRHTRLYEHETGSRKP